MISDLRCSEDKEGSFKVIAGIFMATEVILFKGLSLISSIVFKMFVQVRILLL